MKDKEKLIKELKNERGLLEEKRNKLENFLYNNDIDSHHKSLLIEQLHVMGQYIDILSRRIRGLVGEII